MACPSRVRSAAASGAIRAAKPTSNSEPWLPTSRTSLGSRDSAARSRSARPEMTATVVCGSEASSRIAAAASGMRLRVRRVVHDRGQRPVVVARDQQLRRTGDPRDRRLQLVVEA